MGILRSFSYKERVRDEKQRVESGITYTIPVVSLLMQSESTGYLNLSHASSGYTPLFKESVHIQFKYDFTLR
jgi:hypothetical protein